MPPACLSAEELEKENAKKTTALKGQAVFSIAKVRGPASQGFVLGLQ